MKTETQVFELIVEEAADPFAELSRRNVSSASRVQTGVEQSEDHVLPQRPGVVTGCADLAAGTGVALGELIALADDGRVPLILYGDQPGSAMRARTTVDLHAAHVGRQVVLAFEGGDPAKPIVVGVLRGADDCSLPDSSGQVAIEADGTRFVISAKEQLVLRCGTASITLTRAGKVLIQGDYVLSRSSGVNRIKGGSVQLN
jgi:CTP:molybdopterin cytidylyltransferase MocA